MPQSSFHEWLESGRPCGSFRAWLEEERLHDVENGVKTIRDMLAPGEVFRHYDFVRCPDGRRRFKVMLEIHKPREEET